MKQPGLTVILLGIAFTILIITIPVSLLFPSNEIEIRIKNDLKHHGEYQTAVDYIIRAPFKEEGHYRIIAVFIIFIFRKISVRNPFYWLLVGVPTYFWAFAHDYPPIYQILILIGGLFSDGLILYFNQRDHWTNRIKVILAPILAHAEVNLIIVGWIVFKGMYLPFMK